MIPVLLQQEYTGSEVTIPVASQSLTSGCKTNSQWIAGGGR